MKKMICVLLISALALSLCACSSGKSDDTAQESSEASEESSGEKDNEELSDAQKALKEAEAALAESEARNGSSESGEVNEYGITDQSLQDLADLIKENVTDDYLNVYNISPSDFSWPEANNIFWGETRFVMQQLSNGNFTSEPPEKLDNLSEEDSALAVAMMSGIHEWVSAGGDFNALFVNALSEGNSVSAEKTTQFLMDNVTFE